MIKVPKDPIFQETEGIVKEKQVGKTVVSGVSRSWRMLNRDQRGMLVAGLFVVLVLPIAAIGVQQQVINESRATKEGTTDQNPRPTPMILTSQLPVGYVGEIYSGQVEVSAESILVPLKIDISGLPQGLRLGNCGANTIDKESVLSCRLEGTPELTGNFQIQVVVTDKIGSKNQQAYRLSIE